MAARMDGRLGVCPACSAARALRPQRQSEGEAGARARRAVDGDVAAHEAGEAAGDVEAEAGAAWLARVDPLEAGENPIVVRFGNALALVGDDDRGKVTFPLATQPDLAALRRVADRVGDEVHHHL